MAKKSGPKAKQVKAMQPPVKKGGGDGKSPTRPRSRSKA